MIGRGREPLVRGSLLLMESLWIYALVAFIVAATVGGGKPTLLGVLVVVGGSWTISRFLQANTMSLAPLRIWGALLSLLLFYAVVRIDFFGDFVLWDFSWLDRLINHTRDALAADSPGSKAIIGVPLLVIFWMRGILSGQQPIEFPDVLSSFALGFGVIATVLVFGSLVDELPRGVELIAVPYVGVGLMALGLQHASQASDSFEREYTPAWLVAIMGAVAVMALIALLFVVIDFGTAQDGLAAVAFGVGWVFAGILAILAWPLIKLFEGAFWLFDFLTGGLDAREQPVQVQGEPGGEASDGEASGDSVLPGWVGDLVRYGIAGVLIVMVAAAFALSFRRLQRPQSAGENKESVYAEGRLAADLGNLLGSVFRRGRGRVPRTNEPARRLYFDMLAAAQRRGVERQPTETPLDLAPRLQSAFASQTPGEITVLFDDVRYGGAEADADEVQRLRTRWEELRGT